jgi:H+-transporting ATPase
MPVIMLMLITLLNDGTLIAIGYDNVVPQDTPTVWNLRVLFTVGTVLASVACISSLLLLKMSLESWQEGSFYQVIGLGGISYGQITTSIFLKVAVSDFLTLFSARAGELWFWSSRPANVLLIAAALALSTSTLLACVWPMSRPDGIPTLGLQRRPPHILPLYIWIYCIVWWIVQVSPLIAMNPRCAKISELTPLPPTRFSGCCKSTNVPIPQALQRFWLQ